jgi:hypothetical protein
MEGVHGMICAVQAQCVTLPGLTILISVSQVPTYVLCATFFSKTHASQPQHRPHSDMARQVASRITMLCLRKHGLRISLPAFPRTAAASGQEQSAALRATGPSAALPS